VLYHFEFHGEHAWEAFGSGEGSGAEPIALALADLRRLAGGELLAGEYRCIAASGGTARRESLRLGKGGRIMVDRGRRAWPSSPARRSRPPSGVST
jgi:hypothetical protein